MASVLEFLGIFARKLCRKLLENGLCYGWMLGIYDIIVSDIHKRYCVKQGEFSWFVIRILAGSVDIDFYSLFL